MKTTTNTSFILRRPGRAGSSSVFRLPSSVFLPAFSIIEVMFAIMILGIGFILVAAIFPVAIQQSQATVDETQGRLVAQNGAHMLAAMFRAIPLAADKDQFAVAATYAPLPAALPYLEQLRYDPQDTRYSWVALYRRDVATYPAQIDLIVVGVRATTTSGFELSHLANTSLISAAIVAPTVVPGSPVEVTLAGEMAEAAVEGAVLINEATGQQYRLAGFNDITGRWQLEPGSATPTAGAHSLLGRALRDPAKVWDNDPSHVGPLQFYNPHEGPCQVTSVVTVRAKMP